MGLFITCALCVYVAPIHWLSPALGLSHHTLFHSFTIRRRRFLEIKMIPCPIWLNLPCLQLSQCPFCYLCMRTMPEESWWRAQNKEGGGQFLHSSVAASPVQGRDDFAVSGSSLGTAVETMSVSPVQGTDGFTVSGSSLGTAAETVQPQAACVLLWTPSPLGWGWV